MGSPSPSGGLAEALRETGLAEGSAEELLTRMARHSGWQHAAHDHLRMADRHAYRMAVDEYRANWRMLVPVTKRARVLELNCGHGAASLVLAEVSGGVVAVEEDATAATFAALRARQEEAAGLRVVRSSLAGPLPFGDGVFDLVAFSGPLSRERLWALVEEAGRLLTADGQLYVATRNRLRPGVPGNAVTAAELQRALRGAGFAQVALWAPLPSHELAFFFLPLDQPQVWAYYVRRLFEVYDFGADLSRQGRGPLYQAAKWGARVACRLRLTGPARHMVPSIAAVASR